MAKPELGTKRTCLETGKNFYDLNKDPIVSPYTQKEYPLSFFNVEVEPKKPKVEPEKPEKPVKEVTDNDENDDEEGEAGPQIISLEEVDEDDDVDDEDAEVIADIPSVELDDEDDVKPNDDTFLEEEDDDTDLSAVIGSHDNENKEDI